jgi:hypothetical protein
LATLAFNIKLEVLGFRFFPSILEDI